MHRRAGSRGSADICASRAPLRVPARKFCTESPLTHWRWQATDKTQANPAALRPRTNQPAFRAAKAQTSLAGRGQGLTAPPWTQRSVLRREPSQYLRTGGHESPGFSAFGVPLVVVIECVHTRRCTRNRNATAAFPLAPPPSDGVEKSHGHPASNCNTITAHRTEGRYHTRSFSHNGHGVVIDSM